MPVQAAPLSAKAARTCAAETLTGGFKSQLDVGLAAGMAAGFAEGQK